MTIKYIPKDLFRRENKDICEMIENHKDLIYAMVKGKNISFVATSVEKAVEVGLLPNKDIPKKDTSEVWKSKTINVKKKKRFI